jgi:hypothetical protein
MGPTQTAPALKEWLPSNCSATVVTNPRHSYTPLTYGVANRERPITRITFRLTPER